jgi:Glyoxalase-like domain
LRLNGGGSGGRRPRLEFDHVQVAVDELDVAAGRFAKRYGLVAVEGGHHPGRGTGNMIVPLGRSYLELIAVMDDSEAQALPTSIRVRRALESRRTFATWAVRTEDLEATRADLAAHGVPPASSEIVSGRRRRPDGQELAWRSVELVPNGEFSAMPFLIEWDVAPGLFPGASAPAHPSGARGILSIVLSDPDPEGARADLARLLATDLDYSVEKGPPGVLEITLDTPAGPLRVR